MNHLSDDCRCEGTYCKKCQKIQCIRAYKQGYTKYKDKEYMHLICIACNARRVRQWKENNPEKAKVTHRKHQAEYKRTHLGVDRKWQDKNPEQYRILNTAKRARRRTMLAGNGGFYTMQEWLDLKKKYNYTCLCCRKQEPEIKLCADHVIPVIKGGTSNIDNIEPLCRSCNAHKSSKTIDYRLK